jgi:hypothetical protein
MNQESFKLPGSSYQELAKIIRAYGHAPDDAVPKDVADRAGIDSTVVSRNNAFLVSVGILTAGKRKSLTLSGRALSQAFDYEMPEKISSAWKSIISENDFLRKVISAVRIRGGMDASALRNHVAFTAGQAKKPTTITGAGSVIDILLVAGMLKDEDGKIISISEPLENIVNKDIVENKIIKNVIAPSIQPILGTEYPVPSNIRPSFQLQIRIDCKPSELDQLAEQLHQFFDKLDENKKKEPHQES